MIRNLLHAVTALALIFIALKLDTHAACQAGSESACSTLRGGALFARLN